MKPASVEGRDVLRDLSLLRPWDALLGSYFEAIETLTEEIQEFERVLEEHAGSLEQTRRLLTFTHDSHGRTRDLLPCEIRALYAAASP